MRDQRFSLSFATVSSRNPDASLLTRSAQTIDGQMPAPTVWSCDIEAAIELLMFGPNSIPELASRFLAASRRS